MSESGKSACASFYSKILGKICQIYYVYNIENCTIRRQDS